MCVMWLCRCALTKSSVSYTWDTGVTTLNNLQKFAESWVCLPCDECDPTLMKPQCVLPFPHFVMT